ncbi:hypothetical protein [Microbacterium candidum]|uniref:Type 4 fimbrial biogenesis protein PilX N-terminal domain-containing protein n=1 Tax=Microbacterium candidum TaxID=3041922 RepID=A0ABT7N3X6_9MICO|nr:hypothetical protein [Microbacterium sp. ASV49]MDL9981375.1 hypothetical protein [Microbacterium sp. ASV49]
MRFLRHEHDEDPESGVALVMVVVVMLVGFVIASLIGASLLFTLKANQTNKSQTEAFVAAESGRDAMLAAVMANGCTKSISDSSTPVYKNVSALFGSDAAHLTDNCLSSSATATIQITSTGVGPGGDQTTVVSQYQRLVTTDQQPGGSLAYFSGTFKLTQSTYKGDVVIRDGNYTCTSQSTITGDLWVPRGGVDISAKCNVNGNIYARDAIRITGSQTVIGTQTDATTGTLACQNCTAFGGPSGPPSGISVDASNSVVWKDVLSSTNIDLKNTTIHGNVSAGGVVTTQNSTSPTPTQNVTPSPSANAFNPSLDDVYAMTNWLDIGFDKSQWGTNVQWKTIAAGNCSYNVSSDLQTPPTGGNTRFGFDYSNCPTNVTITMGGGVVTASAVFLVPASAIMNVNVTGNVSSGSPVPQLFFIHADANPTLAGPNCGPSPTQPVDTYNQSNNLTVAPYLMFYTPCGLGNNLNQNQVMFSGQFYAADNETSPNHWVQPNFTCQPMAWTPLINLGCYIKDAVLNGNNGTIQTTVHPPSLSSQMEQ